MSTSLCNNMTLSKEDQQNDAKDMLQVLWQQEEKHYRCHNYLERPIVSSSNNNNVDKSDSQQQLCKSPSAVDVQCLHQQQNTVEDSMSFWRQQMLDWAYMVVDSFQLDRELVALAFSFLDRYVARELTTLPLTRDDFQLFSMTCLYLAIKITQPYPRKLGLEALVDMSRGFYSLQDLEQTEMDILRSLNWHTSPPTAMQVARLLGQALWATDDLKCMRTCATLTEMALADPWFLDCRTCIVGVASLWHAARLDGLLQDNSWQELSLLLSVRDQEELVVVYHQLERLFGQ